MMKRHDSKQISRALKLTAIRIVKDLRRRRSRQQGQRDRVWIHLSLILRPPSRYVCRMQLSLKMREEFYVQFIGIKTTFLSSAYFTYGKLLFFVSSFFCCGRKQKILPNVERGAYSFEITLDVHGFAHSIRKINR